eukprot:1072997_1
MVQFGSIVAAIIYIQMILHIHSQYNTIWSDDMNQNNGWNASGDVSFAYSKGGCSSLCTRVRADRAVNEPDAYIYRSTNVSAYTTLRLQVNGSRINLEPGDACRIYYGWSQSDKN